MSDEKSWTCRMCMKPCRYLIIDKTGYALLPGYCEEHGASMLRPMENSVVTAATPMPSAEVHLVCPRCKRTVTVDRRPEDGDAPRVDERCPNCADNEGAYEPDDEASAPSSGVAKEPK